MKNKTALQFALYRYASDVYHIFYQNADGTFCRVTTDVKGNKTWVNYFSASEVGTQIYSACLLGYKICDVKQKPSSMSLSEYVRNERMKGDNDDS